jgi:hypothetical protein
LEARGKDTPCAFSFVSLDKPLRARVITVDNKCAIVRCSLKNSFLHGMIRRGRAVKIKMGTPQIRNSNRVTGNTRKRMLGKELA